MKPMDSSLNSSSRRILGMLALLGVIVGLGTAAHARPSSKGTKSGAQTLSFLRQTNVYSNIEFFYTNRGILFNSGGTGEGCFWPRGSGNSYIFGEGLWFATIKEINGKRRKLCELGYNPNSGAGWYKEGEYASVMNLTTDGANSDAKYISYVGPRYDKASGTFLSGSSSVVPSPYYKWPIWDTSTTKKLDHNFYFGDYISDVNVRNNLSAEAKNGGTTVKPAILSEEDIVDEYTDQDPTNNPEFQQGTGYPFGIDVTEAIYTWSFGRYRDMLFLRQKVTNSSSDSLLDCWMAPAFDPDLAYNQTAARNDQVSYVTDSFMTHTADPASIAALREPYRSDPTKLNMGVQWSDYNSPPGGQQYGWIGFSFLESPVIDSAGNIIANDDSLDLHGYGPASLFQTRQRGLVTFKDWNIDNDPSTQDLRYNFVSSGEKDGASAPADARLMMGTGPFTLPPHKSVETVVGVTIAQVDPKSYQKNFGALLLLADFAHQVFGEVDSSILAVTIDTTGKHDTTYSYFVNHFLSPVPPDIPNVKTTALNKAVLVSWDHTADSSVDLVSGIPGSVATPNATLPFLGYQLWRSTRKDHDSTIRPDGINPDVMLGQWQLYDFRADSEFDAQGHFNHFHYTRLNTTPHPLPHSYLDFGDDDHDGILTGNEGLFNGVTYYYYLIAYDEYDSTNKIGPLYTAVVSPKNFVTGTPNRPVYLVPFQGDSSTDVVGSCLAGSGMIGPNFGGLQDVRLQIVDTGIFSKLFTDDTINVSFQPRWIEQADQYLNLSYMLNFVDVTDTRNGIQNTYAKLQNPANSTNAYFFPTTLPGAIILHVNQTITPDSVFPAAFTTDNSAFAPNQTIDNAFNVLADVNLEQLSAPYRLASVSVPPRPNNPQVDLNILRLSRRTNNGSDGDANQDIYHLPTDTQLNNGQGSTRPSFLGALGQTTYEVDFGNPITPGPVAVAMNGTTTLNPTVLPITVRLADCPNAILREVPTTAQDTTNDMTIEYDYRYYTNLNPNISTKYPMFNDPDTMRVPDPGWYEMDAFHFRDLVPPSQQHTNASFIGQGPALGATVGSYYFPMDSENVNGVFHYTVHRLKVGGAEIIFNAPEIPDQAGALIGDTIAGNVAGHQNPHTNDFQAGDKIMLSFTGLVKNLPFPGAQFSIKTEGGPKVDFSNVNNYTNSILSQVQVVPNPYVVTHLGQTSTDNAKIFFTRLPPRCTIEIYALDGTLVNTIEHIGYQSTTTQNPSNLAQSVTTYDYSQLADQSSTETWNLLTSGKQRVGSQVLFARVIAKDPSSGAEIGETTTKFAVVVAQSK